MFRKTLGSESPAPIEQNLSCTLPCADPIMQIPFANSLVQILSCKFYLQIPRARGYCRAQSILRSTAQVPFCRFYCLDFIVYTPLYAFHCADSIGRILLCEAYSANSIVHIPSHCEDSIMHLSCGFYPVNLIEQNPLCEIVMVDSLVLSPK